MVEVREQLGVGAPCFSWPHGWVGPGRTFELAFQVELASKPRFCGVVFFFPCSGCLSHLRATCLIFNSAAALSVLRCAWIAHKDLEEAGWETFFCYQKLG